MVGKNNEKDTIRDMLAVSPVIAAVKNDEGLSKCMETDCSLIFVLYGNICSIEEIVEQIKAGGRTAIVHADLIQGLSSRNEAIDYIKERTKADGIISTKSSIVKYAKELGLTAVLRTFMIDSMAMENVGRQIAQVFPDMIEIMPGIMPEIIRKIRDRTDIPIIAGGLLSTKRNIIDAFDAGADAVSTTNPELWNI